MKTKQQEKRSSALRSGGLVLRAVEKWKSAERRYQRDCNIRWALKRVDAKRRALSQAASVSFHEMMNVLNASTQNKVDNTPSNP